MSADTEVLSWRRAAVRLGWSDSRASSGKLRAIVRRREREVRTRIYVRRGPKGGWGGVTMAMLRQHCPELFRAGKKEQTDLRQVFAEHLESIGERIRDGAREVVEREVDPRIDELHGRDASLERRIHAVEGELGWIRSGRANGTKRPETEPTPSE